MSDLRPRPNCHRAEDLVTYIYNEASAADAADFRSHLNQCDACRTEFALFNQVHESIVLWRNEALSGSRTAVAAATANAHTVRQADSAFDGQTLSAAAAVRQFFSVAPLWLRGATAFAGVLFCALIVFTWSRGWPSSPAVANKSELKVFTKAEFDSEVARQVRNEKEKLAQSTPAPNDERTVQSSPRGEVAVIRRRPKPRTKGLTLEERQQLAADLRLVPADDEELPFEDEEPDR